jgi:hypothetical protein
VSDANVLVRPDPPLSEHDEAGIIAAAVELGIMHSDDESRRLLRVAVGEVHRLTLLLEEREATIAALLAKPKLRVVREEAIQIPEWAEVKR